MRRLAEDLHDSYQGEAGAHPRLAPGLPPSEDWEHGPTTLWTACLILLAFWALGMLTSTSMGGLVHALLVAAIVVALMGLIQGRRLD